jgi:DNA-binding NarL/FixJ family response regulator
VSLRAVLVAHRRAMVAEGIAAGLAGRPGIVVLGAATTAPEVERRSARADAVALDPGFPGAEALADGLRRRGVRVVWLDPLRGIRGGSGAEAEPGEARVSLDEPIGALAEALVPGSGQLPRRALSPRQERVLALVAQGLTAGQVARRLGISEKTVEKHKAAIFRKLGVPNQAAAVHAALRRGGGVGR